MGSALAGHLAWAIDVEVAEAPTTDLGLAVAAIQSAQSTLLLNIYELTSPQIADALLGRINAGVQVEIIEEGQPVGGLSAAAKGIQTQLADAMKSSRAGDRLLEMSSKAGGKRRFRYDHAKYAVIDGQRLLIGSENYSPTGNPVPGTKGNRGWEVVIHDVAIAQTFESMFQSDADTSAGDLLDLTRSAALDVRRKPKPKPTHPAPIQPAPVNSAPVGNAPALEAAAITPVTSPDSSLKGLLALIDGAQTSLEIEQMTIDPNWGTHGGQSPLVDAILRAARRGVQVRVLLNDESVFNHSSKPSKPKNPVTADSLNQAASSEGLSLTAKIADIKAMGVDYIHNKGALADGHLTLISSINWDENSIEKNRETAVLIDSADVNAHYLALFDRDWSVSGGTAALRAYARAPAALLTSNEVINEAKLCPATLSLTARIGVLKTSSDAGFGALSGSTVTANLVRTKSSTESCELEDRQGSGVNARKFLLVRENRDGMISLIFEGYTPGTDKLYSIRAKIAQDAELSGTVSASVYDGSGPGKGYLGKASLELGATANTESALSDSFADAQSSATPPCLGDQGQALAVDDAVVLGYKANTPNQTHERAHVLGTVDRVFPDQNGHHHFEIVIGSGASDVLEVIYNEDFGALPAIQTGMSVEACGDYITSTAPSGPYPESPSGAIIHWVHRTNNAKKHPGGYLVINGQFYN
ncbi:MAG: phospholipase D-like domain-containing protein [Bdellovibrionota bacterium]